MSTELPVVRPIGAGMQCVEIVREPWSEQIGAEALSPLRRDRGYYLPARLF